LVTVGGTATGAGNLISGNATGIFVLLQDFFSSAEGSVIQGNAIGLDTTRTVAIPNSVFGMRAFLNNALYPLQIGGTAAGAGNLVSGNTGGGIEIGQADNVVVQGNRIGTLADGVTPLGNGGTGIQLSSSTHSNVIGGIGAGEANVVAFSSGATPYTAMREKGSTWPTINSTRSRLP
jgi:hypothetical protein